MERYLSSSSSWIVSRLIPFIDVYRIGRRDLDTEGRLDFYIKYRRLDFDVENCLIKVLFLVSTVNNGRMYYKTQRTDRGDSVSEGTGTDVICLHDYVITLVD